MTANAALAPLAGERKYEVKEEFNDGSSRLI